MEFLKNTTSPEQPNSNNYNETQEIIYEQILVIKSLMKKLFTPDEIDNLLTKKLEKLDSPEQLNSISFNLEKIHSGLIALSNHDFSIENDIESLAEKAKIQENIINGFYFIKNLFEIDTELSIEKNLNFIKKNYAN